MLIVYCHKCGKRLGPADLPNGVAPETAASDLLCQACQPHGIAVVLAGGKDRPSESLLKPARRSASSSTHIPAAKKSGIHPLPGIETSTTEPPLRRKHVLPAREASKVVPVLAGVLTCGLVLTGFLIFGRHPDKTDPGQQAKESASVTSPETLEKPVRGSATQERPAQPQPPAPAVRSASQNLPIQAAPVASVEPKPVPAKEPPAPEPAVSQAVPAEPTPAPAPAPAPQPALDEMKTIRASNGEEEESLETKAPAKPPAVPKNPLLPLLEEPKAPLVQAAPQPKPDAAQDKKHEEFQQKLRRGDWLPLFTRDDRALWEFDRVDGWKPDGDTATGKGKLMLKGVKVQNYELKLDASVSGKQFTVCARSNDDVIYRVHFGETTVTGQVYDIKQKKIKRTFEKVDVDTKTFHKLLIQSKGGHLRATLDDKHVLIDLADAPLDTYGFSLNTHYAKATVKNVSLRVLP